MPGSRCRISRAAQPFSDSDRNSTAVFARSLFSGEDVAAAIDRASRSADGFDVTAAFRELLVAGAFEQPGSLSEPTNRHNDRSWRS